MFGRIWTTVGRISEGFGVFSEGFGVFSEGFGVIWACFGGSKGWTPPVARVASYPAPLGKGAKGCAPIRPYPAPMRPYPAPLGGRPRKTFPRSGRGVAGLPHFWKVFQQTPSPLPHFWKVFRQTFPRGKGSVGRGEGSVGRGEGVCWKTFQKVWQR